MVGGHVAEQAGTAVVDRRETVRAGGQAGRRGTGPLEGAGVGRGRRRRDDRAAGPRRRTARTAARARGECRPDEAREAGGEERAAREHSAGSGAGGHAPDDCTPASPSRSRRGRGYADPPRGRLAGPLIGRSGARRRHGGGGRRARPGERRGRGGRAGARGRGGAERRTAADRPRGRGPAGRRRRRRPDGRGRHGLAVAVAASRRLRRHGRRPVRPRGHLPGRGPPADAAAALAAGARAAGPGDAAGRRHAHGPPDRRHGRRRRGRGPDGGVGRRRPGQGGGGVQPPGRRGRRDDEDDEDDEEEQS